MEPNIKRAAVPMALYRSSLKKYQENDEFLRAFPKNSDRQIFFDFLNQKYFENGSYNRIKNKHFFSGALHLGGDEYLVLAAACAGPDTAHGSQQTDAATSHADAADKQTDAKSNHTDGMSQANYIDPDFLITIINTSSIEDTLPILDYTRKTEGYFYNIMEKIYDDITIISKDGILEKVLPNFESVYGISAEEAVGMSIYELERRKIFNPCISARVIKSLKPVTMMQLTLNNKYLMCTAIPLFDENGDLERIISYTRDAEMYELLKEEYSSLQNTVDTYSVQLEQLRKELQKDSKVVGVSQKIRRVTDTAVKVAKFDATVLITGESGVGKNMLADLIHSSSDRKDAPFIAINCGAIPEHLLESELFGYEKGAFTGASRVGKAGLIELADNGTLFLDEICDLPLHMQVKLLKVIQEKTVMRIGGILEKKIDFRLIAATNKNIEQMVMEGQFREDLYYRLNVLSLEIPPLRERREDIFPLVNHFTKKYNEKYGLSHAFSSKAIDYLEHYTWPGNVRELENVVERMLLTAEDYSIREEMLPYYIYNNHQTYDYSPSAKTLKGILAEVEKKVLAEAYGKHKSTTKVAKELGISQASVSLKLSKYKIYDKQDQ